MDEYLPMFLAEGREHLQELNLAVVRIEETPDDPETVDEIFRIAHSMKGMSATMGFAGMAALTHEMEDVFELLRQRARRARARGDRRALRQPRRAVGRGRGDRPHRRRGDRAGGADRAPAEPRARAHAESRRPSAPAPRRCPDNLAELSDGRRVVQITAFLNEDVSMPSVRAYMVLSSLAELGETLACRPSPDELDGFDGREVDAWIVSDHADSDLADAAGSVPEVVEVIVFEAVPDAALDDPEELVEDARRRAGRAAVAAAPQRGRRRSRTPRAAPRRSASTPSGWTS